MRYAIPFACALLCVSATAFADDYSDGQTGLSGVAGLRGSLAFDSSLHVKAATTPPVALKANAKVGGGGSVYWGLKLPYGFKTEFEVLYRYLPLSSANVNGASASLGGYAQMVAPMVNAYWNVPVGDIGFQPFVGGGLGYAWNEIGVNNIAGVSFPTAHDDNWRFAYNFMAGASLPINDTSRITGMYRWLHEDIGVYCGTVTKCSGNLNSQSIDLGIEMDL